MTRINKILGAVSIVFLITISTALAQKAPRTIRLGYFESGSYHVAKAMMGEVRRLLESWPGDSLNIVFEPFAYQSAEWKRNLCRSMAGDLARFKNIDMIIAAGPWVVEDLLDAGFDQPIIGICQSYPELQGLVDSAGHPRVKNLTVSYFPGQMENDFALLANLYPGARIGLLYFPSGEEFSSVITEAQMMAQTFGMTLTGAEAYNNNGLFSFFAARNKIRDSVDIFYLPPLWGMEVDKFQQFFSEIHSWRKISFVTDGYLLLEKGAMLTRTDRSYNALARYTVDKIFKIIDGAVPSDLPTRYEDSPVLGLNMAEAATAGKTFRRQNILQAKMILAPPGHPDAFYSLATATELALTENADFKAFEETIANVEGEYRKALGEYFPELNLAAGISTSGNDRESSLHGGVLDREKYVEITLLQRIFSLSSLKAVGAAKKQKEVAGLTLTKARRDLTLAVTLAYLDVLRSEENFQADRDMVSRLRELREITLADSRIGRVDSLDASLLDGQLNTAQAEVIRAENRVRLSRRIFNTLLGRPADQVFVLENQNYGPDIMAQIIYRLESIIPDAGRQKKAEEKLVTLAIENSLDFVSAEKNIGLKRDLLGAEKSKLFPEISLAARYAYSQPLDNYFDYKNDSWSIGAVLSWPLFNMSRSGDKKISQADLEQARFRKDALRLQLMQDILNKSDQVFTLMAVLPLDYRARNISQGNVRDMIDNYELGRRSILELMESLRVNSSAEKQVIAERFEFFSTFAELLHTLGLPYRNIGTPEFESLLQDLNPEK